MDDKVKKAGASLLMSVLTALLSFFGSLLGGSSGANIAMRSGGVETVGVVQYHDAVNQAALAVWEG